MQNSNSEILNLDSIHIPVMLSEILKEASAALTPEKSQLRYFDGTLGRGGHFSKILHSFKDVMALGFDQDDEAINFCSKAFASEIAAGRVVLQKKSFFEFSAEEQGLFDFMLLDLGVSSPQLDTSARGFSFYQDGPLDMRMNQSLELTASDILMTYEEEDLVKIFRNYGEIYKPHRVVRAICHDRKEKLFNSTKDFSALIERIDGWRKRGHHPATQYFMALRLVVNNELAGLEESLKSIMLGLKPKGRLAVLTFHSLEDRIVKNKFRGLTDLGQPVYKKVIVPSEEEEKQNPRSRSAKLRVFERF